MVMPSHFFLSFMSFILYYFVLVPVQARVNVSSVTPSVRLALLQGGRTAPAASQVNISCLYSTLDTASETTDQI